MKIVTINGSPRRDGLTQQLIDQAIIGIESQGAQAEHIFLADYHIEPCQDCRDRTCWSGGECRFSDDLPGLNAKLDAADGIVLGAPVYYLDINGITKNFLDRTRPQNLNGKPAMGIAVAGGTGKGLTSALKSIYYYFFCVGLRGSNPLPVSRFNFARALAEAKQKAADLVEKAKDRKPFRNLAEKFVWHRNIRFMDFDIIDENLYLAGLVIENTHPKSEKGKKDLQEAMREYQQAVEFITQGKKDEAAKYIEAAYVHGTTVWNEGH